MYFTKDTTLYVDRSFVPVSGISVNIFGQTFQYGFGAFEGIRSYEVNNRPLIFKGIEHYQRLRQSCEYVNIPFTFDPEELVEVTYTLLKKNRLTDAYIRPLVYCGENMGLNISNESHLVIAAWKPTKPRRTTPIRLCISDVERTSPGSTVLEAKITGHYVNSIIAKSRAAAKGFDDTVMLDLHGNVAEAPGANIFCEKSGVLFTPPHGNIFPGITRQTVIEICEQCQIEVREQTIDPEFLKLADAVFLCGTASEITAVGSIDDQVFAMPWAATKSAVVQKEYHQLVLGRHLSGVIQ